MQILILLFMATLLNQAGSIDPAHPSLFAKVINVAEDDILNVREEPNYRSQKIGSQVPDAYMGVERCVSIKTSVWCKVYQIVQNIYSEDFNPGWVNARYLKPNNSGYVLIDDKGNCDYALRCKAGLCEVVTNYVQDENGSILNLNITSIKREMLKGESSFGAMCREEECDGYCTSGNYIEDYLQRKKLEQLLGQTPDGVLEHVLKFTNTVNPMWTEKMLSELHPKKPLVMTQNVRFGGKEDLSFGYRDIKNMEKNRKQKLFWGHTYGKGDDVWMSLYAYVDKLTRPLKDITKVEILKDLKGYQCSPSSECRGYELYWTDEISPTKEYDWHGLVVIVEKYKDKWYVVGLLRDRWTI